MRGLADKQARLALRRWRRIRSLRGWILRGALRTLDGPLSDVYGFDRGTPVDRPYIEAFLGRHAQDMRGRVLEVKSDAYARCFGGLRLTGVDVVDIDATNPLATIVADLDVAGALPCGAYDCILLTQTLQFLTPTLALPSLYEALLPGGVLLITASALTRQETQDSDRWRLPPAGLRDVLESCLPDEALVTVEGRGNAVASVASLLGLSVEELGITRLEPLDWRFPVVSTARVQRPAPPR